MACNSFRITLAIGVTGLATIILTVVIGWIVVPIIVRNKIADILPLKEKSESWDRWENPPVTIYFRVYLFHVNNPDEVIQGAVPSVTERGPYVYRETRKKKILSVDAGNSSITYQQTLQFEFDPKESGNVTEDDILTVPNIQAMVLPYVVDNLKAVNPAIHLVNTAIHKIWPSTDNVLFMNVKVKDYLFGRNLLLCNQSNTMENFDVRVICQAIRLINPKGLNLDAGGKGVHSFSLFGYKISSNDGTYEIDSGINDVTKIGEVKTWNGLKSLPTWGGDICNRILGSDGTIFRPYLDLDGTNSLYIYNTDACRSIRLTREGHVNYKGISGVRFVAGDEVFASVLENEENYCFCPQSIKGVTHFGGCLKSGVLDLSSCQGAPAIISQPHFLMADSSYQVVDGLAPDKAKHQIYLDLEPYTGYPLSAASRMQVNAYLKRIPEVSVMKNVRDVLMPCVWIEESVQIPDDLVKLINSQLLDNLHIVDVVRWVIVGLGIVLTASSFSYYFVRLRKSDE